MVMDNAISVINVLESLPPKELEDASKIEDQKTTKTVPNHVSYWNFLYIFAILVGCISATSIVTLIPRHNTIFYPEFWYEPMILFLSTLCPRLTVATILELYILTGVEELRSIKVVLKLFFGYSLSYVVSYTICYASWTLYFDRNHPLPFIATSGYCVYPAYAVAIWYLFPAEKRTHEEIKRKVPLLILYRVFWFVAAFATNGLRIIITILSHVEWASAILIPIVRSLYTWIYSKITEKITGNDNEAANFLVTLHMTYTFAFFKAFNLFHVSQFTVYCILLVELLLHIRTCYQIIRLSRKVNEEPTHAENENIKREKKAKFLDLVITELTEIMTPIVYGLGYATAYFGPNAHLTTNVGSNWYGGKIMTDIQHFYIVMLELFAIDLISMILTTASLNHFCNLHVLQEFCKCLKKYWWIMMLQLIMISYYFGSNDINLAMDFTGNFQWITDEGRYELIRKSTELSLNEKIMLLPNITHP